MRPSGLVWIGAALLAAPAAGQSLAQRVAAAPDGVVRMSFTARPGVCGDGEGVSVRRSSEDWESDCDGGPVRVVLAVAKGRVTDVKTYVGGRWRERAGTVTDLGTVSAPEAAEYLLALAARDEGKVGDRAILPATIADSVVIWPRLLALARDPSRPQQTRKTALFWVAQAAESKATEGLEGVVAAEGDRSVREQAVFALSQRPNDEGVPALIRIARGHPDPALRRRAMFWLGQSDDPRVIAFLEEILSRP